MHIRSALFLLVSCAVLQACAVNPVTGERQLSLVSEEQEVQLGKQAAAETRQQVGLVQNDALQAYVQKVGAPIAAASERPDLPWSFQVVDDPTPNAFALPGGFIFVTRGMLNYLESEAELATVLGHEIAHVTARHSVQQISRAQLAQLGFGLGMVLFPEIQPFEGLLSSGLQLLFLKYSRDAERQADELGFRYALAKDYDVREMDDVFTTLQKISTKEGQSPLPTWASTHPDPGERAKSVQARLGELKVLPENLRVGRDDYLGQIDGLVWGNNPRNGFFKDGQFLHPELAFQLTFPEGWRTQNLPQAVIAGSPERDAAIQLTLTEGTAVEAARRFLTQNGVEPGQPVSEEVNGLPAVVALFRAQTQQGVVQGIVSFIEHAGRTYQIIGFAPAGRYAPMEPVFLQAIASFAPLTDQRILSIQPQRLDIVRIPRDMTLAEFAERYPSSIDLDTLALINQVSDARAELAAGTLLKRVTGDAPDSTKVSSSE